MHSLTCKDVIFLNLESEWTAKNQKISTTFLNWGVDLKPSYIESCCVRTCHQHQRPSGQHFWGSNKALGRIQETRGLNERHNHCNQKQPIWKTSLVTFLTSVSRNCPQLWMWVILNLNNASKTEIYTIL